MEQWAGSVRVTLMYFVTFILLYWIFGLCLVSKALLIDKFSQLSFRFTCAFIAVVFSQSTVLCSTL